MDMRTILLAAGKGVRMKSELPKVLHLLSKKTLISHVIDNVRHSGIDDITVVVGYKGDDVISALGGSVSFVWQREQLGTGHAVLQTKGLFHGFKGQVLVACGDAPLISSKSFSKLADTMKDVSVKAAVLTMILPNPKGYGRMIKDPSGALLKIVEEKDATDEERLVNEVNSGTYIFDAEMLFNGLDNIKNDNVQKEYYLTDVVSYIVNKGFKVVTVPFENPSEGRGINSKEELAALEEEFKNGKLVL
jgi:bifunctional UDP-N-acetylglucosamine pyrophosphorylase / glucosamine-1-phosphate N-acetyltransferase